VTVISDTLRFVFIISYLIAALIKCQPFFRRCPTRSARTAGISTTGLFRADKPATRRDCVDAHVDIIAQGLQGRHRASIPRLPNEPARRMRLATMCQCDRDSIVSICKAGKNSSHPNIISAEKIAETANPVGCLACKAVSSECRRTIRESSATYRVARNIYQNRASRRFQS
jgi:hypothetical protein